MNAPVSLLNERAAEEWRQIVVAPAYAVSSFGRVKRLVAATTRRANTLLTPSPRKKSGYLAVALQIDGKGVTISVHQLVCTAFHGVAPSPQHQAAHYDGDVANNCSDNLRWATPVENAADTTRLGRRLIGDNHPSRTGGQRIIAGDEHWSKRKPDLIVRGESIGTSKLTTKQVREIISEPYRYGLTIELAAKYGVSNVIIGRIRRGLQWTHISKEARP